MTVIALMCSKICKKIFPYVAVLMYFIMVFTFIQIGYDTKAELN